MFITGCSDSDNDEPANDFVDLAKLDTLGPVIETLHEGGSDGLLGGFGLSGLRGTPEFYADAQHLDSLLGLYASAGMNYVPIDYYFKQSLDLMYSHLTEGSELPVSQVVAATAPVDGNITADNLVAIDTATTLPIVIQENRLVVPE